MGFFSPFVFPLELLPWLSVKEKSARNPYPLIPLFPLPHSSLKSLTFRPLILPFLHPMATKPPPILPSLPYPVLCPSTLLFSPHPTRAPRGPTAPYRLVMYGLRGAHGNTEGSLGMWGLLGRWGSRFIVDQTPTLLETDDG